MDVQRFKRHDRHHKYVAFQLGGPFDSLPHWFEELVSKGKAQYTETGIKVLSITGQWRVPFQGDWIVVQDNWDVYEMNNEDFRRNFYAVESSGCGSEPA